MYSLYSDLIKWLSSPWKFIPRSWWSFKLCTSITIKEYDMTCFSVFIWLWQMWWITSCQCSYQRRLPHNLVFASDHVSFDNICPSVCAWTPCIAIKRLVSERLDNKERIFVQYPHCSNEWGEPTLCSGNLAAVAKVGPIHPRIPPRNNPINPIPFSCPNLIKTL